ncbi:MAG: DUF1289 domain-containing protein [Phaeovulum sp.]|jgi:hypothetical protein|uniref:DUF1289 domain-containing protein n=1 Tax=Phaeovulum sp. TaxID=2934796 RepID=UPI00272F46E1|nr:DUF1289 domain-containing protein [Phaeovulum sp.]MDP2064216.1 DUF1289 domain-containing protein [Phaeovulum sp.]MDP3862640.1 DUF1289 domain-containing protein [Phaeovulum sp.]
MSDDVWARDEPQSPCVKTCVMHPTEGLCIGCLRSLAEIASWSQLSPDARRAVLADLPARAPRLTRRQGGSAGRVAKG